jgi:drug/metabolite transporter (DMT)-like permease
MPERSTAWHAAVAVAGGALLIASAPLLVKNLVPDPLGPFACAFWRTLLGGLALAVLARLRGASLHLDRSVAGLAVLAGLLFALDLGTWHEAIRVMPRAGAGLATVLANTQVVWVALVGVFVLKEPRSPRLAVGVALALVGVSLVAGAWTPAGELEVGSVGLLLGLLTGVWYASFLLTLRRALRRPAAPTALVFMAWASLATAFFAGLIALLRDEPMHFEGARAWASVLGLALVVQAAAWWILTRNLARVPAALGALLLLLQPTFATLGGVAFHGEALTVYEVLGAALILAGIYLGATARRAPA